MIDYQTFHQIRHLCDEEHLSAAQIAAALALDERTVSKWIGVKTYQPRKAGKRKSKLDPFKGTIVRLLAQHPWRAVEVRTARRVGGGNHASTFVRAHGVLRRNVRLDFTLGLN
jgi:DNA-binding transcriptional regulator YiaG